MDMDNRIVCALDPALPITPQLYRFLRERIIRSDLRPGDRVSEAEIARSCDVSRQPVREAFIKLAEQGLVTIRPQRGTIVTRIAHDAVLDARFLREAIEADIVKLLATAPDPALITELRVQLDRQRSVRTAEPHDFIELDERFHRTLAEGAGKSGAWKLLEGLKSQMDRVRFLALGRYPVDKLISQHGALVDRIEEGDVAGTEASIRTHLREVLSDLPEIVAANPEYFDLPEGQQAAAKPSSKNGGDET